MSDEPTSAAPRKSPAEELRARRDAERAARDEARTMRRAAARLDRETARARFGMAVDRLIGALWPLFAVVVAFLAIGALGLWTRVPDWARLAILVGLGLGLVLGLRHAWLRMRWPSRQEARAQLDEGAPDRPVASFDEDIAIGADDPTSEALWRAHKRRAAERARSVRAPAPALKVGGRRDPWALRFFAVLALGSGLLLRPADGHLADAFAPVDLDGGASGPPSSVELWATPPAYTGAAPLYFASPEDRRGTRATPSGTIVSVRAFPGAGQTPRLDVDPAPAPGDLVLTEEDGVLSAEITLRGPTDIRLDLGGVPGPQPAIDIRFDALPDLAPTVEFVSDPARSDDGELGFHYAADDDYGIEDAFVTLSLDETAFDDGLRQRPPGPYEPERIEISLPRAGIAELAGIEDEDERLDLAEFVAHSFLGHAWVGLPVEMTITVVDGAGQEAVSEPRRFHLPGRLFSEPMAKAFMEQRAAISWNLENAPRAVRVLEALTQRPEDYFRSFAPFLVARAAISQLGYALAEERVAEVRPEIMARLLRAAELLEDTGIENAWEALQRAQRRLQEALENGASDEEIEQLIDELRDAVDDYVRALQELAEQDPELFQQFMEQQQGESFGGDTLQDLLDQLEETARDGAREQAADMLESLAQLLESLRPAPPQAGGGGEGGEPQSEEQQRRDQTEEDLQELLDDQQDLAEDSFDDFLDRRRREREDDGGDQSGEQGEQSGQQPGQDGDQGQDGGQEGGDSQQGQDGQGQQGGQGGDQQQGQDGAPSGDDGDRAGAGGRDEDAPGDGRGFGSDRSDRGDGGRFGDLAERQEALREGLEQLRRELEDQLEGADDPDGDVGDRAREAEDAFDDAEEAMRRAEDFLRDGQPGAAADEQVRASEALRDAARAIDDAFDRLAEQERPEDEDAERAEDDDVERDPLGRELGGDDTGESARRDGSGGGLDSREGISDEFGAGSGLARAREILEELRRRAAERERPAEELDYIDRLLDLFD